MTQWGDCQRQHLGLRPGARARRLAAHHPADGSSIVIDNLPATDTGGYAGLADEVDLHTWKLLKGVALATVMGVGSELAFGNAESDLVKALQHTSPKRSPAAPALPCTCASPPAARPSTTSRSPTSGAQTHAWTAQRGWCVAAEYVEPGASATDDKRPEFQKMIERACDGENAFDAIVVHSFSRFFRDAFGLEFYVTSA